MPAGRNTHVSQGATTTSDSSGVPHLPNPFADHSMRFCKAFLRRRLTYGPPTRGNSRLGTTEPAAKMSLDKHSSDASTVQDPARLSRCERWWPRGLESQCEDLRGVLRRTIVHRESQSSLLLGYTGTGKSLVLDRVLRCLAEEALDRSAAATGRKRRKPTEVDEKTGQDTGVDVAAQPMPFRAVYLNGLAQTDDSVAMRELVQQLGITGQQGAVYSSNLEMAVQWMKTGAVNGMPVIFVLDEFDRFAYRRPQTLLYALLDLCQEKGICAAVVGLSVNLNVLDVAEKRIKSRFSFRQIHFPSVGFDTLMHILVEALILPGGHFDSNGNASDNGAGGRKGGGDSGGEPLPHGISASFAREFNAVTRQVLLGTNVHTGVVARGLQPTNAGAKSAALDLRALAASGRSIGWFLRLMSTAISLLREEDKGLTRAAVKRAAEMIAPDPQAQALRGLSVTQVLILVSMSRLERRGRNSGCAFQVIFREYESYLRKFSGCPLRFSRAIMFKSFQQLAEQGLIRAAESGSGGGREADPVRQTRFRSRYRPDDVLGALVRERVRAPTNVTQWCKNWQKET